MADDDGIADIRGAFMVPYLLGVKTVTGVVIDGTYHPVSDVGTQQQLTIAAFEADWPMLLEMIYGCGVIGRAGFQAKLERVGTAFYRIMPAASTAPTPVTPPETTVMSAGESRGQIPAARWEEFGETTTRQCNQTNQAG
ncbi:hypothetical protein NKDENANG_00287 [Candidatus Entotheonellaceae bacterium PAL068K]